VGVDAIAKSILVPRHQDIRLDRDLAARYGLTTKRLNEQVKRNLARFPSDFMFQLTVDEEGGRNQTDAQSTLPRRSINRLLALVARFQLMSNGEDQNDIFVREPAIFGDVAELASRQDQLPAPVLGFAAQ
jgi:hypothetical protein